MSPLGPEMCQPEVDEASVLAPGAVARLIPAREDNFRGVTIQPQLRRAEVWIERVAGAARPSRHPGALLASFLLGIGGLPKGAVRERAAHDPDSCSMPWRSASCP